MRDRIHVVEYHGDNRASWACSEGHRWDAVLLDRRRGQARFLHPSRDAEAFERMASWWSLAKGGTNGVCPHCEKLRTTEGSV